MLSLLPDYVDPLRLCTLGKAYEGTIPLAALTRLAPLLTSTEGEAAFVLAFSMEPRRRAVVRVSVRAELVIKCQRCLGDLVHAVDSESTLVIVRGPEEAERLPDDVDPLLVEDAQLELRSLIEDELILAIPPAPRHPPERCQVKLDQLNAPAEAAGAAVEVVREHPFAALAEWKGNKNSD